MKNKNTYLVTKYSKPWVGVPLIEEIIKNNKNSIIVINPNNSIYPRGAIMFYYIMIINIKLILNFSKVRKVIIYNDPILVLSTYPLIKMFNIFRDVKCYYLFESKWFSKMGERLSPYLLFVLNSKDYNKIFVLDEFLREYLESKGLIRDKISIIGTGINFEIFKPNKGKFKGKFLYVGSLDKRREIDKIIMAFHKAINEKRGIKLLIVGDGDDIKNLKELVKNLKLSRSISFTGNIPHQKVSKEIQDSDICITFYPPQIFGIQLPFKTLEYMACRKPVISVDTEANQFYFKNNKNIILIPFKEEKLTEAMILLVENNELREKISKEGYSYVIENFNWENVINKFRKGLFIK